MIIHQGPCRMEIKQIKTVALLLMSAWLIAINDTLDPID
jgi:hypothetical protein